MSDTYLTMWEGVTALDLAATNKLIVDLEPAKGKDVEFNGVRVLDVDILEALRYWRNDLEIDLARRIHDQDTSRVLQIFMDEGMIPDQRQENFD